MIYTYIIQTTALALLISAIKCEPPSEQASLDDLIKEIFTISPPNGNPLNPPSPPTISEHPPRGPDAYGTATTASDHHIPGPPDHSQPLHPINPEPIEENVIGTMFNSLFTRDKMYFLNLF